MKPVRSPFLQVLSVPARLRMWLLKQPAFTSTILPAIPRPMRWMLRRLYFLPMALADRFLGERENMVPPKSEIFTGSVESFTQSGEILVQRLVEFGGLDRNSKVLDVGCGIGRLAVPLTHFLSDDGSYEGLDIVPSGIKWCNENISSQYPRFRFTLADVYNAEYHPTGRFNAAEYHLPYPDENFDLVVLVSVFTHMLPVEMENYITEISRVLRSGGRCFATYFLINGESLRLMEAGISSLRFKHNCGSYWLVNKKLPELSVGYEDAYVRQVFEGSGLLPGEVHYGGWCGRTPFWSRESGLGDQDVVLATKP
jgi:SAM-dependent methyltransferase